MTKGKDGIDGVWSFTRIISLIEAKRIDTSPWITHRAPLSDVVEEFPLWNQG
jgi:threonine dehydrogenase-like Zn-dependent dehydrogenase